MTSLQFLYISENKFTSLPRKCFQRLTHFQQFVTASNMIERLEDGVFEDLPYLVVLDLSNNKLVDISLKDFSNSTNLRNLIKINLSKNRQTFEYLAICSIIGKAMRRYGKLRQKQYHDIHERHRFGYKTYFYGCCHR